MRALLNDFAIGVRLAVGGGRTSLARFVLSTFGVAIAVAVLLLAASIGPMTDAREQRGLAEVPSTEKIDGVAPLYYAATLNEFRSQLISVRLLHATGPTSPKPPGLTTLPTADEIHVSPALGRLLADNPLLRERFPQRVIGTLAPEVVRQPDALVAYIGGDERLAAGKIQEVYRFGKTAVETPLNPPLLLLLLLGSVALLVPVFIFVAASTRIAGAERDRRLSAIRLVGADNRQVRRIAAAESLVSAVAGLAVGVVLFLVGRQAADGVV
ncbi:MAG: ABC transporter permease, partial [Actinomycetota bacterium]|nr:ABC transporter permease [Actinomycetota bacterium]